MPTKKPQFSLVLDPELLKAVEDIQYSRRLKNRTAAITMLLETGIADILEEEAKKNTDTSDDVPVQEEKPLEPVEEIRSTLIRLGVIRTDEDLKTSDRIFLESLFLAVKAHFQQFEEGGE